LLSLRADRDVFLGALDRLPKTLSHFDFHPGNIFGDSAETIVIDWSFVGLGAIGEDAGNLVPDSVFDFHVPPEQIDDLFVSVRDGYLGGLREGGWDGPEEAVDLGMAATAAAKYSWNAPFMLRAASEGRPLLNGRPLEAAFEWWAPVIPWLLKCGERARRLAEAFTE
jgi:thiamine kinase-like enzyme